MFLIRFDGWDGNFSVTIEVIGNVEIMFEGEVMVFVFAGTICLLMLLVK